MSVTKEEIDLAREHYTDDGFLYQQEIEFVGRLLDSAESLNWLVEELDRVCVQGDENRCIDPDEIRNLVAALV